MHPSNNISYKHYYYLSIVTVILHTGNMQRMCKEMCKESISMRSQISISVFFIDLKKYKNKNIAYMQL